MISRDPTRILQLPAVPKDNLGGPYRPYEGPTAPKGAQMGPRDPTKTLQHPTIHKDSFVESLQGSCSTQRYPRTT